MVIFYRLTISFCQPWTLSTGVWMCNMWWGHLVFHLCSSSLSRHLHCCSVKRNCHESLPTCKWIVLQHSFIVDNDVNLWVIMTRKTITSLTRSKNTYIQGHFKIWPEQINWQTAIMLRSLQYCQRRLCSLSDSIEKAEGQTVSFDFCLSEKMRHNRVKLEV